MTIKINKHFNLTINKASGWGYSSNSFMDAVITAVTSALAKVYQNG